MLKKSFLKRSLFLTASLMLFAFIVYPSSANAIELSLAALCPDWGQMEALNKHCKTCEVMLLFFDAANYMTESIASTLADPMVKLMWVCYGLWLAFQTVRFFGTPASELDAGEFGTNVGKMTFRVIFGVAVVSGGCSFVFEYLLEPYLNSVAKLVAVIAGGNMAPTGTPMEYPGPISEDTRTAIDGMIGGFTKPLTDMQNVGFGLMCHGLGGIKIPSDEIVDTLSVIFDIPQIGIPSPLMILFGGFLWVLFAFVGFVYSLTFMDVMMRFCLVLGFIPLVTMAWVFPATKKYASQCWKVFLNTALLFICTAIFLSMIVQIADDSMGGFIGTSDFVESFLELSFVHWWIIEHFAINPLPFILAAVIALVALCGTEIPETVAEHFTGLGFSAIDNCGRKAVKNICNAIISLILLAITIVTWGSTSFLQPLEGVERTAEAIDKAKKLQETLEKLKKWRERLIKMRQHMQRLEQAANL